jgi:hypothetical protein
VTAAGTAGVPQQALTVDLQPQHTCNGSVDADGQEPKVNSSSIDDSSIIAPATAVDTVQGAAGEQDAQRHLDRAAVGGLTFSHFAAADITTDDDEPELVAALQRQLQHAEVGSHQSKWVAVRL